MDNEELGTDKQIKASSLFKHHGWQYHIQLSLQAMTIFRSTRNIWNLMNIGIPAND